MITQIVVIENKLGKFAFTYGDNDDLFYQEFGKNNQIPNPICDHTNL